MIYNLHGTECCFVHKRLFGAAKSFVTSGFSPTAAAVGFLGGGGAPPTRITTPLKIRPPGISGPARHRAHGHTGQTPFHDFTTPSGLAAGGAAAIAARTAVPSTAPRPVSRIALAAATGLPSASARPVSRLALTQPRGPSTTTTGKCGFGFILVRGRCQSIFDPLGLASKPPRPPPPMERPTMARRRDFGEAVVGAFGMPAMVPDEEVRRMLVCPTGMVLGTDDLCYPKGVLSARNLHRKWRRPARAPVTAGDAKAIRTAARARERVLKLAKDVGLHASKSKPAAASKPKAHQHLLAAPAQTLRVISEETN